MKSNGQREKQLRTTRREDRKTILKKTLDREGIFLVEFKAPKELIEAFDSKLKAQFSSRSEALRSLMRAFIIETSERS